MNTPELITERLILRKFTKSDLSALFPILADEEVNKFLPWFVLKDENEVEEFYKKRILSEYKKDKGYMYAICLKQDNIPVGFIKVECGESYDFGYALKQELWNKGIVTEAGRAVIEQLKRDNIPYITATHDVKNPGSGRVMQKLGMQYKYSYNELWKPKNKTVIFRMYQLNLNTHCDFVFEDYKGKYHSFIENDIEFK